MTVLKTWLVRRVAEASFLEVTNLATNMILSKAYVNGNTKKMRTKKITSKPTNSSPTTIKKASVTLHILRTTWKQRRENLRTCIASTRGL